MSDKFLQRGNCFVVTSDDNLTVVQWTNSKLVHTISTYAGALPEDIIQRFYRKEKRKDNVIRSFGIQEYNTFLRGVNLMDKLIAHYPHGFKNKKWYLRFVFNFLNVSIINSWIIYMAYMAMHKYNKI